MPNNIPTYKRKKTLPDFKRKKDDRDRGTAHQRGYDKLWSELRQAYLQEHPLCVMCLKENKLTPAQDVHHIKKVKDYPELRLDPDNLMSVCRRCHNLHYTRYGL